MQCPKSKTMSEFQPFGGAKLELESDLGVCKGTSRELKRFAYTLAEVVLVMLVIAIVVGVSLKITKTKLDNILSVNYYYSYKTLNEIVIEMLKHYNPNNDKYKDEQEYESVTFYLWTEDEFAISPNPYYHGYSYDSWVRYYHSYYSIIKQHNIPIFFDQVYRQDIEAGPPHWYNYVTPQISYEQYLAGQWPDETVNQGIFFIKCNGLYKWSTSITDKYPDWNENEEVTFDLIDRGCHYTDCFHGCDAFSPCERRFEVCSLPCDSNSSSGNCGPLKASIEGGLHGAKWYYPALISDTKGICKNGSECFDSNGQPAIMYGSSGNENYKRQIAYYNCLCPTETNSIFPTIPLQGKNFCEMFASYVNTKEESCNGNAIGTDITDFSSKTPDIILRNGVRLFNMSQNPTKISILNGNSRGNKYTKANGTEVDIDEWGYTVYVDIDGASNGVNKLWEDVYRFYVTLSGNVIPAYDKDNAGESGGDSIQHLQTSVSRIVSGAKIEWVVRSKSFKESACTMGYVKGDYCGDINRNEENCPSDTSKNSTCSLKTITPLKYF